MTDQITVPDQQWSPGYGYVTPGRMIRLWTRDHAPFDVAASKGPRRSTGIASTHVFYADGGKYAIHAHALDATGVPTGPMLTLHGDQFDSMADAHRALFDAGWIAYEETVRVGTGGDYVPPWGARDPDAADDVSDVDGRRADGAAADMVYGRCR